MKIAYLILGIVVTLVGLAWAITGYNPLAYGFAAGLLYLGASFPFVARPS